jgi:hypothetical protein
MAGRAVTIWPPGRCNRSSGGRRWLAGFEVSASWLGLLGIRLVREQALDALVEILRCDALRFAGLEFARYRSLRIVAQGTGLRGGM